MTPAGDLLPTPRSVSRAPSHVEEGTTFVTRTETHIMTEERHADTWTKIAPRGTSYLTDLKLTETGVAARLRHPGGITDIEFDCAPAVVDRSADLGLDHLLAVDIRSSAGTLSCSVLGTTSSGPRRVSVTLGQALGFAKAGVHTVFRSR